VVEQLTSVVVVIGMLRLIEEVLGGLGTLQPRHTAVAVGASDATPPADVPYCLCCHSSLHPELVVVVVQ
jgi:hypothetical protein